MVYKIILTDVATGEETTSCRRFPNRDAATDWATRNVPQFAVPMRWRVEAERLPEAPD